MTKRFLTQFLIRIPHDFVVFQEEWWHFEFGTRRWGALTGEKAKFGVVSPFRN